MLTSFYTDFIRNDKQFKSPLRVADIMLLEPVTRNAVQAIIADAAALGIPLMVFETYRSQVRQRLLFEQGATKLQQVGCHHYGIAADIVKDVGGSPSWKGDFTFLLALAKKRGLISGIDWGEPNVKHSFIDSDHVQRVALADQDRLFSGMWYPSDNYVAGGDDAES